MGIIATAIYENGILRLLTPLTLPEHTRVQIQVESVADEPAEPVGHALQNLLALATDLSVADLEQHDHYLYGVEKR